MRVGKTLTYLFYTILLICCISLIILFFRTQQKNNEHSGENAHFVVIVPANDIQKDAVQEAVADFAEQYSANVEFYDFTTLSEQKQMLRLLANVDVDGVLLWPISIDDYDYQDELASLKNAGIPVVVVERDIGEDFRQSFVASNSPSVQLILEQSIKTLQPEDTLMIGNLMVKGQKQTVELIRLGLQNTNEIAPEEIIDKKLRQLALTPPEGYFVTEHFCLEEQQAQSLNLKYTLISFFSSSTSPALFLSLDSSLTGTVISAKKSLFLSEKDELKLLCYGSVSQYQDSLSSGILDGLITSRPDVSVSIGLRYLRDINHGYWVPATMDSGIDLMMPD